MPIQFWSFFRQPLCRVAGVSLLAFTCTLLAPGSGAAQEEETSSSESVRSSTAAGPQETQETELASAQPPTGDEATTATDTTDAASTTEAVAPRKVAVFVRNRAGKAYDEKLPALEDQLIAHLSGLHFQLISREDVLQSLSRWQSDQPDGKPTTDQLLEQDHSALRLARLMEADLLLVATITSVSREESRLRRADLNLDRAFQVEKLQVAWRLLDASAGGSFQGGTAEVRQQIQQSATRQSAAPALDHLLAQAALQIASQFEARSVLAQLPAAKSQTGEITFQVICLSDDLQVPEVVRLEDGSLTVGGKPLTLEALQVPVELNGIVIGSSSQLLTAPAGLHTLRLVREGFEPWERSVNLRDGLVLQVPLSFSEAGLTRWREMTRFLQDLKSGERLSDAQAERVQGFAQMLRQSGVRVDRRSDVKVDTQEAPTIHQHQTTVDQQNITAPGSVWP